MREIWLQVLENIIPFLASAVTASLVLFLRAAQKHLEKKLDIRIANDTMYELEALARDATNYADEVAHKLVKNGKGAPSNDDKEQLATDYLLLVANKHGLTEERARKLVLSALGGLRKGRTPMI